VVDAFGPVAAPPWLAQHIIFFAPLEPESRIECRHSAFAPQAWDGYRHGPR
jgi:hypothetical protein